MHSVSSIQDCSMTRFRYPEPDSRLTQSSSLPSHVSITTARRGRVSGPLGKVTGDRRVHPARQSVVAQQGPECTVGDGRFAPLPASNA
jgi:hypothetical protein